MKLTNKQLNQIASNIEGLSHIINEFDTDVQIELIKRLEANCNNLLQILKQIESSFEPNYLTYVEFKKKVLDNDIVTVTNWYKYYRINKEENDTECDLYYRKIAEINEIIVPNL